MEDLNSMRQVYQESTTLLCANLEPESVIRPLFTGGELTLDNVQTIRHQVTNSGKVEKLLEILSCKPVTHYVYFMVALRAVGERGDLYDLVKAIARKHNFNPGNYTCTLPF